MQWSMSERGEELSARALTRSFLSCQKSKEFDRRYERCVAKYGQGYIMASELNSSATIVEHEHSLYVMENKQIARSRL